MANPNKLLKIFCSMLNATKLRARVVTELTMMHILKNRNKVDLMKILLAQKRTLKKVVNTA